MTLPLAGVAASGEPFHFAGETVLEVVGNRAATFHLPVDASVNYLELSTDSPEAVVAIRGPGGFWLMKDGDEFYGPHGNVSQGLGAGTHWVYVFTSPPGPARLTLRFSDLDGRADYTLATPVQAAVRPMTADSLPAIPTGGGVQRFEARQPFDGEAFGMQLIVETIEGEHDALREYRWSTDDGILFCYSHYHGSTGLGTSHVVIRSSWSPRHTLPMDMAYFRQSPSIFTHTSVKGIWYTPLPDDLLGGKDWLWRPPLWGTVGNHPILDQDAMCAQQKAGFVMQTLGLGPVELPS